MFLAMLLKAAGERERERKDAHKGAVSISYSVGNRTKVPVPRDTPDT